MILPQQSTQEVLLEAIRKREKEIAIGLMREVKKLLWITLVLVGVNVLLLGVLISKMWFVF